MNIFTYGTLMEPSLFRAVCGKAFLSKKAVLSEYARYRVKNETYPGIIHSPGRRVKGVVYLDVDDGSIHRLDRFENVYFYFRTAVSVKAETGMIPAETYAVKWEHRDVLSHEAWDFENFRKHHKQAYLDEIFCHR